MKYTAKFKSIDNQLYRVDIITDGDSSTSSELTLGQNPFITEMDHGEETIYKPCKYQSATIDIITSDYKFDIYSATAQGTKVELWKLAEDEFEIRPFGLVEEVEEELQIGGGIDIGGGLDPNPPVFMRDELMWTGYVTPNLYDQGFNEDREEISIEAIDALSSLQYYKYTPVSATKGIVSFLEIINHLLERCGAYKYFYISNNLNTNQQNESITEKLVISEQNFYDSKDSDETDEDVAWTCQEVLEEICQYLGLTCVADGDSVYLLDYDAIKYGNNGYYRYTVGNINAKQSITKNFNKTITASDYSSNGATLSLDNVYNKAVVKAELYDYEKVLPDFFDNAVNVTKQDTALENTTDAYSGYYGEFIDGSDPMLVFINRVTGIQNDDVFNAVFLKYYNNPSFKFYRYDAQGNEITDTTGINYTDTQNFNGAVLAKVDVKKLDKGKAIEYWDSQANYRDPVRISLDRFLAENEVSNINFSDYILMMNHNDGHINNSNILNYPFFETTLDIQNNGFFGGKNAYLLISGSFLFHSMDSYEYPIQSDVVDIDQGRKTFNTRQYYLKAKLQVGNKFWTGNGWIEREQSFNIDNKKDEGTDGWNRYDHIMFKDQKFVNTVSWRIGTNKTGYLIEMPDDVLIYGMPKLTIYKPMDFEGQTSAYPSNFVALKDFKLEAIVGDPTFGNNQDTDTVYTNVIDEDFVNELDEIKFKINTWNDKSPNFSCVGYKNGTTYTYLDTVYNNALKLKQQGTQRFDGTVSDGSMRFEEQLIFRIANQYATPSIKLELNLRNNNKMYGRYQDTTLYGRFFIADAINTDYKMNAQTVKLIEKK